MDKKIIDTLNGALNKQLIENFTVIRNDGTVLSDDEVMQLTRPYFKAIIHAEEQPDEGEFHWEETPVQKQFSETQRLAVSETEEAAAARVFVETVVPMCNACCEDGKTGMSLYNGDQMILAFVRGQQWLRDRIAQRVPLDTITAEGAMNVLKDFLYAIPNDWSIEQAIEHLKEIDNPNKGLK